MPQPYKRQWLVLGGGLLGTSLVGAMALLTGVSAAFAPPEATPLVREVETIAVVDGQELSRDRFNLLLAAMYEKARLGDQNVPGAQGRTMKLDLADRLIEEHLIEDAAADLGLNAQEVDIDETLGQFMQRFNTEADFQRYVDGYPLGLPELRKQLRLRWLQERLAQAEAVPLSDDTVRAFYDSAPEQYDAPGQPGVRRPFEEVKEQVRADCLRFMQHRQAEALLPRLRARAQIQNHLADRMDVKPETRSYEGKPSSILSGPLPPSPSSSHDLPRTVGTPPLTP